MATTLRDEIRETLAGSKEPLTRPEIFEKCKFAGDENALSTVLSQLCIDGSIKKVGERERIGGRALALYSAGEARAARGGAKKRRAAKKAKPPKDKKTRTKPLRKVQRRNA